MANAALDGSNINQSTASGHITYEIRERTGTSPTYCNSWDDEGNCVGWGGGDAIYEWVRYTTSSRVDGIAVGSVSNVKIEGKAPIVAGDKTKEDDSYTLPSGGRYVSGNHTGAQGSVTSGNNSNVFINGKSAAIIGSPIRTHASTSTTIKDNGSSTVNIG